MLIAGLLSAYRLTGKVMGRDGMSGFLQVSRNAVYQKLEAVDITLEDLHAKSLQELIGIEVE